MPTEEEKTAEINRRIARGCLLVAVLVAIPIVAFAIYLIWGFWGIWRLNSR
jgi:hypothetical protein